METEIRFDRETKDFALYLDGAYVGSAPNYSEGEKRLNALKYEALLHGATLEQIEELFRQELAPLQARLEQAIAKLNA